MPKGPAPKDRLILSVNTGSSSLKISLFTLSDARKEANSRGKIDGDEPVRLLLTCSISGITSPPATLTFKPTAFLSPGGDDVATIKDEQMDSITDHSSALEHFLDRLKQEASIDRSEIAHVCHRVVHGGDYTAPVVIDDEAYNHIEELSDLAPLHNKAALSCIKASITALPHARSIAWFDSAFHHDIAVHISSYAINAQVAADRGLRKYGFHGLSYSFILRSVSKFFNKPANELNIIALHLGSGASACAIKAGRSHDTSMGVTPLSGLPGATRSGDVDPSLIFHYTRSASESVGQMGYNRKLAREIHITEAEEILNKQAGWKALTGTTDFKVITEKADLASPSPGPEENFTAATVPNPYRLAFDIFVDRILHYVGAYFLSLEGHVDALVLAGGIGEKSVELRNAIGRRVKCLGFDAIDDAKNKGVGRGDDGVVVDIGNHNGSRRVLVCQTDEQLEMARQCALEDKFWED